MRFPVITLARHGQTEWSAAGKHTGLTDLALTPTGERAAAALGQRLADFTGPVFASNLQRASRTAALAGFPDATIDADLAEWDYGDYEGLTTAEIRAARPGWELLRDGCPGGESAADVAARVGRVIEKVRALERDVILFSSGHCLRVLAACWLGQDAALARFFQLDTGTVSELGYYHALSEPCVRLWNDASHLSG